MRSFRVILSFLLLVIVSEYIKADTTFNPNPQWENWKVLAFHGLTNQSLIDTMHMATEAVLDHGSSQDYVKMSKYLRTKMAEKFGGSWSCFTQTEPFHYSVLRRASIYIKALFYNKERIFCFK